MGFAPIMGARRARAIHGALLLGLGLLLASEPLHAEAAQGEPEPGVVAPQPDEEVRLCETGVGEQTARRVQARYDGIRDLRATFRQTNEAATFAGEPLMSPEPKTGTVMFSKPGKMRWIYEQPEPSVVVSDGAVLWIYDVDGKSVTRLEVTAGFLSGAALQFLLGDGQILESFDVTATACDGDFVHLDLVPRAASSYERLGLVANATTGDIVETAVADLFGNLTRIEFGSIETNLDPPSSLFEFEIPEGVELIDYPSSPAG